MSSQRLPVTVTQPLDTPSLILPSDTPGDSSKPRGDELLAVHKFSELVGQALMMIGVKRPFPNLGHNVSVPQTPG